MTCSQCGVSLQPGSGFCGACGRAAAAPSYSPPQGYPPPQAYAPQGVAPPQGYSAPQSYPSQQAMAQASYPPLPPIAQGSYPPPPPMAQASYPPLPPIAQGSYPAPTPNAQVQVQVQAQAPAAAIRPFPLIMQQKLTRLTGQMFLAPTRLYFICESQKGGLGVALGKGFGGLIGGAIMAFAAPTPGEAAPVIDENMLQRAANEKPGSLIMEPAKIDKIKDTLFTHAIWFEGRTYALPEGLGKELKRELGLWCQGNNVKSAGLLPK